MKLNMNDASDMFGNVISIQPQILTINGKKMNNPKEEKNENTKQNENNLYIIERSQIEQNLEDFNSYENLLSRILDEPIDYEKGNNDNVQKKKIKKQNDTKKILEKKKPKGNLLIQNYFDNKINRIKTRDFEIKKLKNNILDNKSADKEKEKIISPRKIRDCQRSSKEVYNIPQVKTYPIKKANHKTQSETQLPINKDIYNNKSNKSEIELSKSIHKSERFSIEGDFISEHSIQNDKYEEQKAYDFEIENLDNNPNKLSNKPVYVLTNQIVNINKKSIINNLDKKDSNNTTSKISNSTKRIEKKQFKEEYIQTEEYELKKKNHITNQYTFSVEGKKKKFRFCCF